MADKKQEFGNVERDREVGTPLPGSDSDLGRRIAWVIDKIGSAASANKADKSVRQMARYARGAEVPVQVICALADAAGVSVEWLATGKEPVTPAEPDEPESGVPPAVIDAEILKLASDFMEMKEKKQGARFVSEDARYEAFELIYRNAFYAREASRQPMNDAVAEAYYKEHQRLKERWPHLVKNPGKRKV